MGFWGQKPKKIENLGSKMPEKLLRDGPSQFFNYKPYKFTVAIFGHFENFEKKVFFLSGKSSFLALFPT